MESYYQNYMAVLSSSLGRVEFTNFEGLKMGFKQGLDAWVAHTTRANSEGNSIYFIGNGASAAMASHMAADACKNGNLKAKSLNDISLVTAISNDIDYRSVFKLQIDRYGNAGDILITISSSGNSPNVIAAIETARSKKMKVITVSGMKENNQSRSLGDINVYLPCDRYGIAESGHQAILHCWLDQYLETIGVVM